MKFGPFRPDAAITADPALLRRAVNVTYIQGGYGPVPSFVRLPTADPVPAQPRGGVHGVNADGVYTSFIGTEFSIQRMSNSGAWTEVFSGAGLPGGDNWSFAAFGKFIIASNRNDGMLYYDLDLGGAFTAIPNAPKARIVFQAFGCLFAGDCDGNNRLLMNSDAYDPFNWSTRLASRQEMQVGEEILGGGETGISSAILIQRNGVTPMMRGDTRGLLYSMGTTWTGSGAEGPDSILFVRGFALFVNSKGFFATDGGIPIQIGDGKVDQFFLSRVTDISGVQAAYWPSRNVAVFRYKTGDSSGPDNQTDDALLIDLSDQFRFEFTEMTETLAYVVQMATPGYVLDDLDAFGTLDSMPQIALGSRYWYGGEPRMMGIDADGYPGFLDGPSAPAWVLTSTASQPVSTLVSRARVNSDGAPTVTIFGSDSLSAPMAAFGPFARARGDVTPTRARGKNIAFRVDQPTDWTFMTGIDDISASQGGAL